MRRRRLRRKHWRAEKNGNDAGQHLREHPNTSAVQRYCEHSNMAPAPAIACGRGLSYLRHPEISGRRYTRSMRTVLFTGLTVALLALRVDAQEKPLPKNEVRVQIPGCA